MSPVRGFTRRRERGCVRNCKGRGVGSASRSGCRHSLRFTEVEGTLRELVAEYGSLRPTNPGYPLPLQSTGSLAADQNPCTGGPWSGVEPRASGIQLALL